MEPITITARSGERQRRPAPDEQVEEPMTEEYEEDEGNAESDET